MDFELDFTLKKKKKKVKDESAAATVVIDVPSEEQIFKVPVLDDDEPISYMEMLSRIYRVIEERNPDMKRPDEAKIRLRPVRCGRVGTAKTAFINFLEECRCLNREPEHLSRFFWAETGSKVSITEDNQLMLRGRFSSQHIETILIRYINDYVKCLVCKSGDTRLERDQKSRMTFLICSNCASRRSVLPISVETGTQDS